MVGINGSTISLTRGDTLDASLEILYRDGSPYTVQEGDVIRFALKRRYSDREPVIRKEIPAGTYFEIRWDREGTLRWFRNEYFVIEIETYDNINLSTNDQEVNAA